MIRGRLAKLVPSRLPDPQVDGARDSQWSLIASPSDTESAPARELVALALAAVVSTLDVDMEPIASRCNPESAAWVRTWPGEHYRLLAGLVRSLTPRTVVEIGTFLGEGSLSLAHGHPGVRVVTYDIIPWHQFERTNLRASDFADAGGQIEQRIGDLGDPSFLESQLDTLRGADLIFIDGPKDGMWEQRALPGLLESVAGSQPLVLCDDTRVLNFLEVWRHLPGDKVDLTGFGHWSGTGLLRPSVP